MIRVALRSTVSGATIAAGHHNRDDAARWTYESQCMQTLYWRRRNKKVKALEVAPFRSEHEFEQAVFETPEVLAEIFLLKRQIRGELPLSHPPWGQSSRYNHFRSDVLTEYPPEARQDAASALAEGWN